MHKFRRIVVLALSFGLILAGLNYADAGANEEAPGEIDVEGSFTPAGPPSQPPVRVDAGTSCIVDLEQKYTVSGTLSGTFTVDFRILVKGPCGKPVGTFDEEWIAHGTFAGDLDGTKSASAFTYTATVDAGGNVNGEIVLGHGLSGRLEVSGNFSDGRLTYSGRAKVAGESSA